MDSISKCGEVQRAPSPQWACTPCHSLDLPCNLHPVFPVPMKLCRRARCTQSHCTCFLNTGPGHMSRCYSHSGVKLVQGHPPAARSRKTSPFTSGEEAESPVAWGMSPRPCRDFHGDSVPCSVLSGPSKCLWEHDPGRFTILPRRSMFLSSKCRVLMRKGQLNAVLGEDVGLRSG